MIAEAIDSVVRQDFQHELMELIIVDGCSYDKTIPIIRERLSRTDISYKIFSENAGLGYARQIVVDNASGTYIVWVDGDIILSQNYISQQVDFMEHHPLSGIAQGTHGLLNDDNQVAILENIGYVVNSIIHHGKETLGLIGTQGSIYRAEAMKTTRFDSDIKGAGEDEDVAYQIKKIGWKLYITDAVFYHRQKRTWKALWNEHFWYGYGLHFIQHKYRDLFSEKPTRWVILSSLAYKLTHRKVVFLLPLNFIFKKTALVFGFTMAHIDGYGHKAS